MGQGVNNSCQSRRSSDNNITNSAALQQNNSSQSPGQQKSHHSLNQEKSKFTKLRPMESHREFNRNQPPMHPNDYPRPGKDTRVFPSPYKSFSTYTGHPSPRQFPMSAGPRPYYSGQGQSCGRGRIWGGQGGNTERSIQKKKQVKKVKKVMK